MASLSPNPGVSISRTLCSIFSNITFENFEITDYVPLLTSFIANRGRRYFSNTREFRRDDLPVPVPPMTKILRVSRCWGGCFSSSTCILLTNMCWF